MLNSYEIFSTQSYEDGNYNDVVNTTKLLFHIPFIFFFNCFKIIRNIKIIRKG